MSMRRKQARPQRVSEDDRPSLSLALAPCPSVAGEMGASDCHVCGVCSTQFQSIHAFLDHKQICFVEDEDDEDTEQEDLVCMYCMCSMPSQGALLWHTVSSHAQDLPLECVLCQEQFANPKQLVTHCSEAHKELSDADLDRPKSCPVPGAIIEICSRETDSAPPSEIMTELYAASIERILQRKSNENSRCSSSSGLVIAEGTNETGEIPLDLSSSLHPKAQLLNHLLQQSNNNPHLEIYPQNKMPLPFSLSSIMANNNSPPAWTPFRSALGGGAMPPNMNFAMPPVSGGHADSTPMGEEDWEAMMEISNVDENEKIRQLVGDKAAPVTDPNQCMLCRRILSCKSALQMHYRTHTGERPFKCKICQRAFTTKGNLKTHMGVHRSKHPFRMFHQCPICQKRFFTAQLLQQHIRLHTSQLTAPQTLIHPVDHHHMFIKPEHGTQASEVEEKTQSPTQIITESNNISMPPTPSFPIPTTSYSTGHPAIEMPTLSPRPNTTCNICFKVFACNSALEIHYRSHTKDRPFKCTVCNRGFSTKGNMKQHMLTHKIRDMTNGCEEVENSPMNIISQSACSSLSGSSPGPQLLPTEMQMQVDDRKCDKVIMSPLNPNPSPLLMDTNPLDAIKKMWDRTSASPPKKTPQLAKHQCGVCFKHFSSSSALQIHMRTHTGDKPFKCPVCSRAFTTKGNLKVHMGTHMSVNPSRRGRRIFDLGSAPPFSPFTSFRLPLIGLAPSNSFMSVSHRESGRGTEESEQSSPASSIGQGEGGSTNRSPRSNGSSSDVVHSDPQDMHALFRAASQGRPPYMDTPGGLDTVMWMWRHVCSVCHKVCQGSAQLEQHLKTHLSAQTLDKSQSNTAVA